MGSSWYCNPAPRASSFVQQILKKPPHHTLCYLTLLTKDLCPFTICYCETPCRASCKLLQHTIHAMAAYGSIHVVASIIQYTFLQRTNGLVRLHDTFMCKHELRKGLSNVVKRECAGC